MLVSIFRAKYTMLASIPTAPKTLYLGLPQIDHNGPKKAELLVNDRSYNSQVTYTYTIPSTQSVNIILTPLSGSLSTGDVDLFVGSGLRRINSTNTGNSMDSVVYNSMLQ